MSGARFIGATTFLLLAACSLGPHPPQVVGRARAPISFHAVRVYLPQCAPARYDTVAKLDASKLGLNSSYQANKRWIELLSKQAAGMGANGLLLIPIASAATVGPDRHGPPFEARAIWTPSTITPPADATVLAVAAGSRSQGPFFNGELIWKQQILTWVQAVGPLDWAASCAKETKPFIYEVGHGQAPRTL